MQKENAPVTLGNESANGRVHSTKIDRILDALKLPGGLNRFQAERLGDHCLNSTIAQLREDGFNIHDEWEIVPTRYNPKGVRVKRYRCLGGPRHVAQ